mmetsp:Transcript_403/g.906  ORF Transcript_403/g.906 Transcript_403/m.906 type:complete len:377 (-) Transcript_403:361-1491(-)
MLDASGSSTVALLVLLPPLCFPDARSPKRVEDAMGRPPPSNQHRQTIDDEQYIGLREALPQDQRQQQHVVAAARSHRGAFRGSRRRNGGSKGHRLVPVAGHAKDRLEGRDVPDQPVGPGGKTRHQHRRRHPRLHGLGQRPGRGTVQRIVVAKGPVEVPGDQPAGTERNAGRSLRAQEWSPVVQQGFPGADLEGVVDGGVPEGNVRVRGQVDPDRVLEVYHVVEGVEFFDGLRDGHRRVVQESPDDGVVDGMARKGVQKENGDVARHDELVLGGRGDHPFENLVAEALRDLGEAVFAAAAAARNVRLPHEVALGVSRSEVAPGISDRAELVFDVFSVAARRQRRRGRSSFPRSVSEGRRRGSEGREGRGCRNRFGYR